MNSESSSLVFLQYLTTVFDNIQDAILLIGVGSDNEYQLLLANPGYLRSTGSKKVESGSNIKEIFTPRVYQKLTKHYKKAAVDKEPITFTEDLEMPLGCQTYEIRIIPILNAVGECVQLAVIMRDITELHHLRTKLAGTLESLEGVANTLRRV